MACETGAPEMVWMPAVLRTLQDFLVPLVLMLTQKKEDTLYVHLYMGSTIEKRSGKTQPRSRSKADFSMEQQSQRRGFRNGQEIYHCPAYAWLVPRHESHRTGRGRDREKDGYLYITKVWKKGEKVELIFLQWRSHAAGRLR